MAAATIADGLSSPAASSDQLVRSIMARKPRLGELLRLMAVPFWFDEGLVVALRAEDDGQTENILTLLDQFSFVHTGYGRYWYSGNMRQSLLQQWAGDPEGLVAAHRRALGYFERKLANSPPDDLPVREEFAAAHLYHLLAVDQRAGIERLLVLFREASDEHRLATAETYVSVADEQAANLSEESRAYLDYLNGRLQQLRQRWSASQKSLEQLLKREDLPAALRPYVRRSVADTFTQLGKTADAIPVYEKSLAEFEEAGDALQAGLTMAALGNAHLTLALEVWGSGWLRRPSPRSWLQSVLGLGHLLVRLPLVLYLLWRLGPKALLPVAHRVGSRMDWIVARVLVTASDWFYRAETPLEGVDEGTGLVEVREGLAQLYRLLDHPQRAIELNYEILQMDTVQTNGYRAARARLGIAHSLLLQQKAVESAEVLNELLPVFRRFEHHRRVAQTQMLLAEGALLLGQPDEAIRFHRDALIEWQAVGDQAAATETVQAMEAIRNLQAISPQNTEVVEQTSQQFTERLYRVRYQHPMLTAFAQGMLVFLVILFFFTVRLALRSESGIQVDATASLVKPIQREIPTSTEMSPDVSLTIDQQLRPNPPVELTGIVVAASFAGYLLLYTVVGWLVIVTTPISRIKPGAVQAVRANSRGIRLLKPEGSDEYLAWSEVAVLLRSDRIVVRRPLQALSYFALFSEDSPLVVSARTHHYMELESLVRRRVEGRQDNKVPIYDLGFNLIRSKSGWLFLISLIYLLGFFVVAVLKPDLVTGHYASIPYNAVDFYWLAYLGLALPLAWWFAVQPLRAHWLVSVKTPLVWWVGGAGLALAVISLVQIFRWHLPLGRPDIVTAVVAILLVSVTSRHVLRARAPAVNGKDKEYAYPVPVRIAVGVIAFVTLAAMVFAIAWEVIGFHYLAVGNSHLRQAEALRSNDLDKEAEEAYLQALEAYDRSLWFRPEAYIYNSQGAVLNRLGRFRDALKAYKLARKANPDEPTYIINEALVYESQASAPGSADRALGHYQATIRHLTEAIEQMKARPDHYRPQMSTAYLLRGGAQYDRGQIYLNKRQKAKADGDQEAEAKWHGAALNDFINAFNDYAWLVAHAPDRFSLASGFVGRGWARFRLRESTEDLDQKRGYLERAISDFTEGLDQNSREISGKIGRLYANYFLSLTYSQCAQGQDPDEAGLYQQHMESAVEAATDVIVQERAAIHYWVRAHLVWALRHCDDRTARAQYEKSRTDYDHAITLRVKEVEGTQEGVPASWYNTRGNLSYALANYGYADDPKMQEAARQQALKDYLTATQIEPQEMEWWRDLVGVAHEWKMHDHEIEGYREMALRGPTAQKDYAYYRLGWFVYLYNQDYEQSLEYSARSLELNPDRAAVHFNEALVYVALGELEAAVQSYLNGIEAADRSSDEQDRWNRYSWAAGDLNTIHADPEGAAGSFVAVLDAARGSELGQRPQACALDEEATDGVPVLLRAEPHLLSEPPVGVLLEDDEFFPAARSPQDGWIYGMIKRQERSADGRRLWHWPEGKRGWTSDDDSVLSCPPEIDIASLPVVDPTQMGSQ